MKFGIGFTWWGRAGLGSGESLKRAEIEGLGAAGWFGGEVSIGLKLAIPPPRPRARFLSRLGYCWELAWEVPMGCSVGIFPLFWPVPWLRAPCHFLADSHPVASWTEGTGKVWGGRGSAVSPDILGASVPGPQLAEALSHAASPLTTHTPLGLPHLLP